MYGKGSLAFRRNDSSGILNKPDDFPQKETRVHSGIDKLRSEREPIKLTSFIFTIKTSWRTDLRYTSVRILKKSHYSRNSSSNGEWNAYQPETRFSHSSAPNSVHRRRPVHMTRAVSRESICEYFHLPLREAAGMMGLCPTSLKRLCRRKGIDRWPYRRLKSLDAKITKLRRQLYQRTNFREKHQRELAHYEAVREVTLHPPALASLFGEMVKEKEKVFFNQISEQIIWHDEVRASDCPTETPEAAKSVVPPPSSTSVFSFQPPPDLNKSQDTVPFSSSSFLAPQFNFPNPVPIAVTPPPLVLPPIQHLLRSCEELERGTSQMFGV